MCDRSCNFIVWFLFVFICFFLSLFVGELFCYGFLPIGCGALVTPSVVWVCCVFQCNLI